jgi:predicted Zn-dependent peptidase
MAKIVNLKNGIPLYFEEIETSKSVSLGIYVKTGSKYENKGEEGISHFLEHMLFKGTKTRNAMMISEEIDDVGGHINAFTSKETTGYYVTILSEYVDKAIEILSDIYLNSTFPEEEIEKEKKVVIEEIRMYEDIPEEKIHDENSEFVLHGSGAANSVLGTEESVAGLTRDSIVKYWKERYTTDNMAVVIAGNFKENEIISAFEKYFENFNSKMALRDYNKKFSLSNGEKIIKKESNQVHLCFNTAGLSFLDKDKYVLSIISSVLGGNMSSRLFQKIREDKGLAYSVYTYSTSYYEGGMFTAYAGTTKENYKEVIEIIKNEFNNIRENGITEDELRKSKNQILSSMVFSMETSKGRMSRLGNMFTNYGEIILIDETVERIKKVTREEVVELSKKIFDENNYSLTVLGDI